MDEPSSSSDAPVSAKKSYIDHMLALDQKSTFVPEKAAELFVDDHKGSIVVSYQCTPDECTILEIHNKD